MAEGVRMAVMWTFDFDAESSWLARDPENAGRLGVLSQGLYGAKRAVPAIMDLLAQTKMPATFYIPGWVVDHHTDRCKEIRDARLRDRPSRLLASVGGSEESRGANARTSIARAKCSIAFSA